MIKLASLRGGVFLLSLLGAGCATNPSGQADGSSDSKACRLMMEPGATIASMVCKTKAQWAIIDGGPGAGSTNYERRTPQRRSAFDALDQQGKR